MLIWIDGPCGVGKTSTACEVAKMLPEGCVEFLDADCYFQDMLQQNGRLILTGSRPQNNRVFRLKFREIIEEKLRFCSGHIIAVMTATSENSKVELLDYFRERRTDTLHIILTASEETVRSRIRSDPRRAGTTAGCNLAWFKNDMTFLRDNYSGDVWINADGKLPSDIAKEIVRLITKQ